jgi:1-acyl-sn-glycerol-3-phosphate acyltransferase
VFYRIIYVFLKLVYPLLFRLKSEGAKNIPKDGAVIICVNHVHLIDPVSIIVTAKRPVYFLAKAELFKNKLFGAVLKKMKAISLERGTNDMNAYRAAIKVLKDGGVLGVFAQGHRMKELDIKAAKAGVALFALKGGAVVVPAYVEGKYRPFSKTLIRYGEPIDLSGYAGQRLHTELLAEITEGIMQKIAELGESGKIQTDKSDDTKPV